MIADQSSFQRFDPSWFSGLVPRVLVVVGEGFSREQIKESVIAACGVVAGQWIFTLEQLAQEVYQSIHSGNEIQPWSDAGRQEFYRLLFSNRSVLGAFPRLKALKRQSRFYQRLDRAVMTCRGSVAHEFERSVIEERLQNEGLGDHELRAEILRLSETLESWLRAEQLADGPRWLSLASDALSSQQSRLLRGREKLLYFSVEEAQGAQAVFLDQLRQHLPVMTDHSPGCNPDPGSTPSLWSWNRSHTLHDGVQRLVDTIQKQDWSKQVLLIPDSEPEVRMVLRRALAEAEIPEQDPRDPQALRIEEKYKKLFRSLDVVASGWGASHTQALVSDLFGQAPSSTNTIHVPGSTSVVLTREQMAKIQSRLATLGSRPGVNGVMGVLRHQVSEAVLSRLQEIEREFQGRYDFSGLRERLTRFWHQSFEWFRSDRVLGAWLEEFWKQWQGELERLELLSVRFPALLWRERLRGRFELQVASSQPLKPKHGVRVFRLSQAQAFEGDLEVSVIGMSASWFSPRSDSDWYWGGRERDRLSGEFVVRSSHAIRKSRQQALLSWLNGAKRVEFIDSAFSFDGSENESFERALEDLAGACAQMPQIERRDWGAHSRFLASYGLVRRSVGGSVTLGSTVSDDALMKLTATDLDTLSRCSFLGLLRARWKLSEREEADWDLWPRVKGVLYHRAVEKLAQALPEPGQDSVAFVQELWKSIWLEALSAGEVPGWIRSPQLEIQIERQAHRVLLAFLEQEREYRARSGVRLFAAEDQAQLNWLLLDARGRSAEIRGKADRIDEHAEGLFVLDYKTGVQALKGADILEKGYRLQMPFYALAARAHFQKPVLGVQFVELTRDARRSVGLFPKRLNGKGAGCLTRVGPTNSGLYSAEPDDLWVAFEEKIRKVVERYRDGSFEARPVLGASECRECPGRSICGQSRREWVQNQEQESESVT
ncbi:MAG: hypothetical protein RJB38_1481 [Pseudomonadota bacterium]